MSSSYTIPKDYARIPVTIRGSSCPTIRLSYEPWGPNPTPNLAGNHVASTFTYFFLQLHCSLLGWSYQVLWRDCKLSQLAFQDSEPWNPRIKVSAIVDHCLFICFTKRMGDDLSSHPLTPPAWCIVSELRRSCMRCLHKKYYQGIWCRIFAFKNVSTLLLLQHKTKKGNRTPDLFSATILRLVGRCIIRTEGPSSLTTFHPKTNSLLRLSPSPSLLLISSECIISLSQPQPRNP